MKYRISKLLVLVAAIALLVGVVFFLKWSSFGSVALWNLSNGGKWLMPLLVVSALIDSINPCAFSILLLTIAFLFSLGKARHQILQIGGVYILGIYLVYLAIGLGILHAMHLFNTPHFMAKVGAALLILWGGVNVINEFFPAFPIKLRIPHAAHRQMAALMEKSSLPAAFLLGGLVGLCEFPCTGGPYLMVLGLLHDAATYLKGVGYLILYNLIFISPLVIILFIASDKQLVEKVQGWRKKETKAMRMGVGITMIALGIFIFLL